MAERHARAMKKMAIYQRLLSLESSSQDSGTLPCNNLPVAQNQRFFGRKDLLRQLDEHLKAADNQSSLSSVALHGLGGVGKTQIALAYAYQKLQDLDAIFWVSAEETYSVQQSLSRIALDALKLPKAQPQAHQENMILVMDWLQKTSAKWLMIFDNVDSHEVLEHCWPASQHGAVLVTTRDAIVATLPIEKGLEVSEFNPDDGADFLLYLSHNRKRSESETEAAKHVASELDGLPLAINQMAALINARRCSIQEFGILYSKYDQRLHKEKKSGWKYLGYEHSLDTVWKLSFESLSADARACLGVLSYLSPDCASRNLHTFR
ncbi:P-loop containing nucleoside triphosphate hydrolase protein [Lophiotrema nucula]|uniref:P-loop containing nucleoside triphosphate hydrolase protein n=1 Tax=Lophiotrema nucula TaxID=690887 RepID=A0A6A5ZAW3_9PLEO|nr:P-loop containing nucleoside triphosphate hydrolase protein [Lophiotrema nucula]